MAGYVSRFHLCLRMLATRGLFSLAFRNVTRHKTRTAMSLSAIGAGVAAIVVAGGFIHDVYIQLGESLIHSNYGHLQIYRSGYSAHGTQQPAAYLIDDPSAVVSYARDLPSTTMVLRRLRFSGVANAGAGDWAISGQGVEPGLENQLGTSLQLVQGRRLLVGDRYAVVIGDGVAKALHVGPGDVLTISAFTAEGALNVLDFDVAGIFRSYSKEYDERAVRLPLSAAQELMLTKGVNEIVVALKNTSDTDSAARSLRKRVGAIGFEVKTWTQLADFYSKTVRLFDRQFEFLQAVLLLMIVLSVGNAINTAIFERLPEFGTMLALGDRRRDLSRLILVECAVLGAMGSALGIFAGIGLALTLSVVGIQMPPPPNAELGYTASIRIVPSVLVTAFAAGTLSTLLAGIVPSFTVARYCPAEALRRAI